MIDVSFEMDGCLFDPDVDLAEVRQMVEGFHYSGYIPSAIQYAATLTDSHGGIAAAILFTVPATRWGESVYELARLVRLPGYRPPLTMLISKACKELVKRKGADLIVSFADSTHGHHGGIYQAASWAFHGKRKPACDGFHINGQFVPRRTCNHRYGTSSAVKVPLICAAKGYTAVPHFDCGKYLYWRAMNHSGRQKAERLNLLALPYPKPRVSP